MCQNQGRWLTTTLAVGWDVHVAARDQIARCPEAVRPAGLTTRLGRVVYAELKRVRLRYNDKATAEIKEISRILFVLLRERRGLRGRLCGDDGRGTSAAPPGRGKICR